jgi:hypothetical protein
MYPAYRLSITIPGLLVIIGLGCSGSGDVSKYYPTYPSGGEYTYDGSTDGEGHSYIQDFSGEWEGFMWEDYRSDFLSLGKKRLAMRVQYRDSTWTSSGWRDWYKIDVLIDGRPAASIVEEIRSGGYYHLNSYQDSIDLEMDGWFRTSSGDGDFKLDWEEKFKDQWGGETIKYRVWITGDYELGKVRGAHWASAWDLFDTYGDGIWTLPDEIWEAATLEGLQYLDSIEESFIRQPE